MTTTRPTAVVVPLSAEAADWLDCQLDHDTLLDVPELILAKGLVFHPAREVLVAVQAAVMRQRLAVENQRRPEPNGA